MTRFSSTFALLWAAWLVSSGSALSAPQPAPGEKAADSAIRFRETAGDWGIDFRHRHGGGGEYYLVETMGAGVVAFDYDGDGDDDLLFVQSGELPGLAERSHYTTLYRNDGDGDFVDVSASAGVQLDLYGMGATAGDVDGDQDPDLYLTAFGKDRLLLNQGDGSFQAAPASAGAANPDWGTSASFADVDRDGDLDLYVTNYVDFSYDKNPICGIQKRGLRTYCNPDPYTGQPDRFYRNRGDGSFEEATAAAGFGSAAGKGMGVVFGDVDRDGWPDLYVANDLTANFLFHNRGDGTFEEIALLSGVAFDERGQMEAGMGVELGDLDANGFPDIIVTHVDEQTNALYSNTGKGIFVDRRWLDRFAEPSYYMVGFGVVLADLDLDADLDAAIANGHIAHNADEWGTGTSFRQRNQVMENLGDGTFREVADPGLDVILSSRGMAAADLDLDGDVDLAINNSDDRAELYENVSAGGHWLAVDVAGGGANVGAALVLSAGGSSQRRELRAASSYCSQNGATAHFGLGSSEAVENLEVAWPDGKRMRLHSPPIGRRLRVER
jgi:hypothetical protein